jgi:hypothetical protein
MLYVCCFFVCASEAKCKTLAAAAVTETVETVDHSAVIPNRLPYAMAGLRSVLSATCFLSFSKQHTQRNRVLLNVSQRYESLHTTSKVPRTIRSQST